MSIFGIDINFPLILTLLTLISGFIVLLDKLYLRKRRTINLKDTASKKEPLLIEYAHSFFPIFLIVLVLRSFLAEPFRIPSGSLEPTLLIGDFIVVNKFIYGLRLPVLDNVVLEIKRPERGDIVVFRWPPDGATYYIKRLIGLPGDHIEYKDKILTINGKKMEQSFIEYTVNLDNQKVEKRTEKLLDVVHEMYVRPDFKSKDFDIVVPENSYFVMGDNRDGSADSRSWGFVPYENLVGKAFATWLSWDGIKGTFRWERIAKKIN